MTEEKRAGRTHEKIWPTDIQSCYVEHSTSKGRFMSKTDFLPREG